MGCTNSSLKNVHEHNPLTETQIRERIEAPKECKGLTIADMKMRYAWVSQRGYYPDGTSGSCYILQDPVSDFNFLFYVALDKENQDAFTCLPQFSRTGCTDQAFFGIFDGHGRDGNYCARYARDYVRLNFVYLDEGCSYRTVCATCLDCKSSLQTRFWTA
jgi:hypothetical protein